MAVGSGLGGQVGIAREGTWGTVQAPTLFTKATSAEVSRTNNVVQGGGFDTTLVEDGSEFALISMAGTASIQSIVRAGMLTGTASPFGLYLQDIFGAAPTPAQQTATIAYLSTFTVGDSGGRSSTIQTAMPNRAGTVYPFTLLGSKITSATFSCTAGDYLRVAMEYDGAQVVESQATATASYLTSVPFHFGDLTFKLGTFGAEAAVVGVKGFSLTFTRPNDTDTSYYANNAVSGVSIKAEQIINDRITVSGSVDVDLSTKADFFDRGTANTSTSMVIALTKVTNPIASTFFPTIAFNVPMTYFGVSTPVLDDNDVVGASIPFTGKWDGTHNLCTGTYMSTGSVA